MPKERRGTVEYDAKKGCYRIRLTLNDGSRPWVDLTPTARSALAEKRAREVAVQRSKIARQENLRAEDFGLKPRAEKVDALAAPATDVMERWLEAWTQHRQRRGLSTASESERMYRRHVAPVIATHVRVWTGDDFRRLSRTLDEKVRTGELSWKSALNVWGVATKMATDAASSKLDEIRCRSDDPSHRVEGPDRGVRKVKQYLYPSELLTLVASERVPIRWRRLFALAVYSYARSGELEALERSDVDLEHATVHVHRSVDRVRNKGKVKSTKSAVARRIPIEPELVPLMRVLVAETQNRIFKMPSVGVLSSKLKHYLAQAGVQRSELFTSDATRKAITFHDLRATGITWCAVRGDDPLKIMQRAGHASFETTRGYIREAENLRSSFGSVFPALPKSLLESSVESSRGRPKSPNAMTSLDKSSGADGNRTRDLLHAMQALSQLSYSPEPYAMGSGRRMNFEKRPARVYLK